MNYLNHFRDRIQKLYLFFREKPVEECGLASQGQREGEREDEQAEQNVQEPPFEEWSQEELLGYLQDCEFHALKNTFK